MDAVIVPKNGHHPRTLQRESPAWRRPCLHLTGRCADTGGGMAPSISTHVLDTERGIPASGVPVNLSRWDGNQLVRLGQDETDADGRIRTLLFDSLEAGSYQITFEVAAYFRELDGEIPFLSRVVIEFEVLDTTRHYHIPLLLSRYSCT